MSGLIDALLATIAVVTVFIAVLLGLAVVVRIVPADMVGAAALLSAGALAGVVYLMVTR